MTTYDHDYDPEGLAEVRAEVRAELAAKQAKDDRENGVYRKYEVRRVDDPSGKHDDCWYFVLDPKHDRHARVALAAYAESVRRDYPHLSDDLRAMVCEA